MGADATVGQGKKQDGTSEPGAPARSDADAKANVPWWILKVSLTVVVYLLLLYGLSVGSMPIVLIEMLVALAAFALGGFLGFLFGLPHVSLQEEPAQASRDEGQSNAGFYPALPRYSPNNNLEQIADWLTKILLGVGLVEIGKISNALAEIGSSVGSALPGPVPAASVVTQVTVVAAVIAGFLSCFLWVRTNYPQIQTTSDAGVYVIAARIREEVGNLKKVVVAVASGNAPTMHSRKTASTKTRAMPGSTVDAAWPQGLQRKVESFLQAAPSYRTDPAAGIFKGATQSTDVRRLDAEILNNLKDALFISLRVVGKTTHALTGKVTFILHPTFDERLLETEVVDGTAEVTIIADGAFTAVAIADDGKTILAYNLNRLPKAPKWFRES